MTINEGSELLRRVERYDTAVNELRTAQQDVRDVLVDTILFERWRQLGAELGYSATSQQRDLAALNGQIPEMSIPEMSQIPETSQSWAG